MLVSEGPWNAHPFYAHPCCVFLEAKPYMIKCAALGYVHCEAVF